MKSSKNHQLNKKAVKEMDDISLDERMDGWMDGQSRERKESEPLQCVSLERLIHLLGTTRPRR